MSGPLLNCPFCGGGAMLVDYGHGMHAVACHVTCGALTSRHSSEVEAISAWNRRSEPRGDDRGSGLRPLALAEPNSGATADTSSAAGADVNGLQLGQRVEISSAHKFAEDWRGTELWVAGLSVGPRGSVNVTVSEAWPPRHLGDLTDGWAPEDLIASAPKAEVEGWRPITEAPRDGTVFVGCNLDHPSFGSWAMYRRVRYSFDDDGNPVAADAGAWAILHGVEPDLQEGYPSGPESVAVIAPDALNTSVRYGWRPLPAPAERNACPVTVDDRTQAASEASEPPTPDGADKPVEGEGG